MAKHLPLQEDIERMKKLQSLGYTNRQIAEIFNVSKSKVWDTLNDRWGKKIFISEWRKIQIAIEVIKIRKSQGKNTVEVSQELNIPLVEVNYIWGTIRTIDLV
jgi:orotate phosphoribosyltransferase-like protein